MNTGNILVIDDEEVVGNLMKEFLSRKEYLVTAVKDAKTGIELCKDDSFDAIFVDLKMPEIDGLGILEHIKKQDQDAVVIMITGYPSFETVRESLRLGAFDYITKPFDLDSLTFTAKRAVDFRRLSRENKNLVGQIAQANIVLEKRILERTEQMRYLYDELQNTYLHAIKALIQAIQARDHYTYIHSENVTKYAVMIAQEMELPDVEVDNIKQACELHDLGKIGISDAILNKPGKLTADEFEQIKLHSAKSAEILEPLKFLGAIIDMIRQHHERFNGKGYPNGLKMQAIVLGARIMAVADAYEAMTSVRPYRKEPFTKQEAIEEIKRNSGTQFDPKVVETFLKIADKL